MKTKIVTGEYSRSGYDVWLNGQCVYSAGNNYQESQTVVPYHYTAAVPLAWLRSYCIQTCREVAAERGAQYGGVERIEDER